MVCHFIQNLWHLECQNEKNKNNYEVFNIKMGSWLWPCIRLIISKRTMGAGDCWLYAYYGSQNVSGLMLKIETVVRRCSAEKVFLENSQNSQKNTCARVSFLIKLQTLGSSILTLAECFPGNFAKFLRTPFFTEHLWWVLLWRKNYCF